MKLKTGIIVLVILGLLETAVNAESNLLLNDPHNVRGQSVSEVEPADQSENNLPADSLSPSSAISSSDNGLIPSFLDLVFPENLQGKEFQVSDHENIRIGAYTIEAKAFGSVTELDMRDNKLVAVTFTGYVLGPYYPDHDYLETYFQTVESIKELVMKERDKQAGDLRAELEECVKILDQFVLRANEVKKNSEFRYQTEKLSAAIRDLYDGAMPEHSRLELSEMNNKKEKFWKADLYFDSENGAQKISRRSIVFQERSEEYAVTEILDKDADGHILVSEKFDYDRYNNLTKHQMESFYVSGQVRLSSLIVYENGVKTNRYYNQYDESGKRLRHLNETYYLEGGVKTSSDYRYTIGRQYFAKYNPTGKTLLSAAAVF